MSKTNLDVSSYVVTLNKLVSELNKITRVTFKPNADEIVRLVAEIKTNADLLKERVENERAN